MPSFRNILVPIDFSPASAQVLRWAAGLAQATGGRLDVLHVCALHEQGPAEAEERMQGAVPAACRPFVEQQRVVRALTADLGIVHEARAAKSDVIVMGTHGASGFAHILLGSVAQRVVQLAGCPVFTIRPDGQVFQRP